MPPPPDVNSCRLPLISPITKQTITYKNSVEYLIFSISFTKSPDYFKHTDRYVSHWMSMKVFSYLGDTRMLSHWGRVTHICVDELGHHWFWWWLVACSVPSHYLNQCWNIVNWTLGNKLQWNLNRISNIFIQENEFENVVWKMAAILSRPQCVKLTSQYHTSWWTGYAMHIGRHVIEPVWLLYSSEHKSLNIQWSITSFTCCHYFHVFTNAKAVTFVTKFIEYCDYRKHLNDNDLD